MVDNFNIICKILRFDNEGEFYFCKPDIFADTYEKV